MHELPTGPRRDGYMYPPRRWASDYAACRGCGQAVPKCALGSHRNGCTNHLKKEKMRDAGGKWGRSERRARR